jgi:serine protease Do
MRCRELCRALAVALLMLAGIPWPLGAEELPPGYAAQVAVLMPAVVAIETIATTPQGHMYFDGSGFIIDPSGIIVTNRHVIAGAWQITAVVPGIGGLNARVLYISSVLDIALLKVDAGRTLPTLRLGDSDKVRVGDEVLLLGNPLGVGLSLSHGVISALNRDIGESMFDHFFQTDGALNHGNSGGPMVNMQGEVIGINTALDSSPGNTGSIGIGFTMPINDARFVIDQFLRDGHVLAGTIGVEAQRVDDDLAAAMGLDRGRGLIVTAVSSSGPAAGHVQVGDIVLSVNGQDATDGRAMARLVAAAPPGKPLALHLLRHRAVQTVTVTVAAESSDPKAAMALLGHAPADARPYATPAHPGMRFGPLTAQERRRLALGDGVKGVAVTAVVPDSAAAERRIVVGDVILRVGDMPVTAPADVTREMRRAIAARQAFLALLVRQQHGPRWVALPLEADR